MVQLHQLFSASSSSTGSALTRLALSALTSSLWGVASGGLSRFLDAALLLTFAGVRLIPGVLQLTFPFGNSPVSCGSSGALGKGPRWRNHLTRAQRQRARHWASPTRGPLHVCSGGPGLIQPLASAAQARKTRPLLQLTSLATTFATLQLTFHFGNLPLPLPSG